MAPGKLIGRWGAYSPKTPAEKAKAKRLEGKRMAAQVAQQAFLEQHKSCANGCGRPVAFWEDSPVLSLRFHGCCSQECYQQLSENMKNQSFT